MMNEDKSTRNRNSVALTSDGINSVRSELKKKGWSYEKWASNGYTCVATVRRLLAGKAIDLIGFKSLTDALQIEIPEICIACKTTSTETTLRMKLTPSDTSVNINDTSQFSHFGFIMTAIFDEDKRMDMKRAILHLQALLIDPDNSHIFFTENEGAVLVTGEFSKENREHIDLAISHIRSLSNCKLTEMRC